MYKTSNEKEEYKSTSDISPLKLVIAESARAKIQYWVDLAPGEVSGLGKVQYFEVTNTLYVENVYLLKQKNTGTSTELDGAEVAKLMFKTHKLPGELKFWWHSHASMPVFWSGTDQDTFKTLGSNGWVCGTVFNKKREMLSAVYAKHEPFNFWAPEVQTQIYTPTPAEWEAEYKAATEDDKPQTPPPLPPKKRRGNKSQRRLKREAGLLNIARDERRDFLRGWADYE